MAVFNDVLVRERISEVLKLVNVPDTRFDSWIKQPPRDTIIRVNTTRNSRKDLAIKLIKILDMQYSSIESFNPPTVHEHPLLSDVLVIKSGGAKGDCVSGTKPAPGAPEIIVGRMCGQAVFRGADVFAPGVTGLPMHVKAGDKVSVYADVDAKCLKGYSKNFDAGRKEYVGNGVMVLSREDLFKSGGAKKGVAVTMTEPVYDCPSLNEAAAGGDFMLQNLPSIVCGHALLQGENSNADIAVLDMCAAPGGKTTHLATMLAAGGGGGLVVALDKSRNKVSQIMANAERQGLKNVRAHAQDASKCVKEGTAKDNIIGTLSPPFDPETFSKILLDAPCSALGQRPQFLNAISLCDLDSFPRIQRKLFVEAVRLLSIGGEVVYSTCTVTKEENEEIVVWALKKFAGVLEIVSFEPAGLGSPGLEVPGLEKEAAEKARRFFIGKEVEDGEDTIGFFIAKFRRIS